MTDEVNAASSPSNAVGFVLTLPVGWYELDVAPATRNASINALVRDRVAASPELKPARDGMVRVLTRIAREAAASGAVYCAAMVEDAGGAPMSAAVTVTVIPDRPGSSTTTDPVAAIVSTLTPKTAKHRDDTWCTVETIRSGDVRAARSFGVEDVQAPEGGGWVRAVTMQTFVPVPGASSVAVVSCSSPNVSLAEPMIDLFEAISSTFSLIDE